MGIHHNPILVLPLVLIVVPNNDLVVVFIPDSGRLYLSTVFDDEWMAGFGFLRADGRFWLGWGVEKIYRKGLHSLYGRPDHLLKAHPLVGRRSS